MSEEMERPKSAHRPPRTWLLWLALFLSVGFNLGLLASRFVAPAPDESAPVEPSGVAHAADRTEQGPLGAGSEWTHDAPSQLRRMVVRMANELGLEGEQREQFFALEQRFFQRTLRQRMRIRALQQNLRSVLASDTSDPAEAERLLDELLQAQGDLERGFVDHVFEARELLDPRQMARYRRFLGHLRRMGQELGARRPVR